MPQFGRRKKGVAVNGVTFTDSESFGLFMEGLRSLKLYSEESEREVPSRKRLKTHLENALDRLGRCETYFPEDILPLYSLGLALTMRNQIRYANYLLQLGERGELKQRMVPVLLLEPLEFPKPEASKPSEKKDPGRPKPTLASSGEYMDKPPQRTWPLLEHAIEAFAKVRNSAEESGAGEMESTAAFNLAHVYAKRDKEGDLEQAENLLMGILQKRDKRKQEGPSFLNMVRRTFEGAKLKPAAEQSDGEESRVNALHAVILLASVKVRRELSRIASASQRMFHRVVEPNFLPLLEQIEKANISSSAKQIDLKADYWTKAGFLTYLEAFAFDPTKDPVNFDKEIREAETYLRRALEFKENWNSAQIYLAQTLQAQGEIGEAKKLLDLVVGTVPEKPSQAPEEKAESSTEKNLEPKASAKETVDSAAEASADWEDREI